MGREISELCKSDKEISIIAGIDKVDLKSEFPVYNNIKDAKEEPDVVLDFSRPDSLEALLAYSTEKNIPLVLCTTGYSEEQLGAIAKASKQVAIFRSANMSLGINVLNRVLKMVTSVLYEGFDIEIIEKHHNQKVDAPSGTALMLADTIKASIPEEVSYVYGREGIKKREHNEIGIHAIRGGNIAGEHQVIFAGQDEIIELTHIATSRNVFALGALKACKFICGKTPNMYNMDDVLDKLIK